VIASSANVRNNPGDTTSQGLLNNTAEVVSKRIAAMQGTIQEATADQLNGRLGRGEGEEREEEGRRKGGCDVPGTPPKVVSKRIAAMQGTIQEATAS
jgi:hypothetical protein